MFISFFKTFSKIVLFTTPFISAVLATFPLYALLYWDKKFSCDIVTFPKFSMGAGPLSTPIALFILLLVISLPIVSYVIAAAFHRKRQDFIAHRTTKVFFTLTAIAFVTTALIGVFIAGLRDTSGGALRLDSHRILDIEQVQTILASHFDEFKNYPRVKGDTSLARWEELGLVLLQNVVERERWQTIMRDPCARDGNPEHQYDYRNSSDGKSYVLRALFQDPTNIDLFSLEDLDGEILGIWCGEQGREIEFCAGP